MELRASDCAGRAFDRMSPSRSCGRPSGLIDRMVLKMPMRRTRRWKLHHRGTLLAPRQMMRRNLGTGGDPVAWLWRRRVARAPGSGPAVRHQRLDGAARPAATALLPRPVADGRAHGGVLLRHSADPHHAPAAPRATPTRRWTASLPRWGTGPAVPASAARSTSSTSAGPAGAPDQRHRARGQRRLGPRRPPAKWGRRPPDCDDLPPTHLAQPACRGVRDTGRWRRAWRRPILISTCSFPSHDLGSLELLAEALADDAGARTGTTLR